MVNTALLGVRVCQALILLFFIPLVQLNGNSLYFFAASSSAGSTSMGALAWNLEGYKAVGMTATSGLNLKPFSLIKRYFSGKDLADIAPWCESMLQHHPLFAHAQFQTYQFLESGDNANRNCDQFDFFFPSGSTSLLNIVHILYRNLNRDPDTSPLQIPNSKLLNDAESIALLAYYLAILHQPLHYDEFNGTFGKNTSTLYHFGNSMERSSLFDLWEEKFINRMIQINPRSWNDGWTHVAQLGEVFAMEKRSFAKSGSSSFNAWARQTASLGCQIYRTVENGMINGTFNVDIQVDTTWNRLIRNQILSAGARVAIVMNEILKDRDQSLRAANELRSFENKIFKKISLPDWSRNFLINFVILCAVVGILGYIGRFYSRSKDSAPRRGYEHLSSEKELEEKHS